MEPVIHCAHAALLDPKELMPHPKNPNEHSKEQIKLFVSILAYQGWRRPITVSNRSGFITRGHGALAAAIEAGYDVVPVDYQDYQDEYQELADIVADNQLQRLSSMNTGKLTTIMADLKETALDLTLTGFEMKTINSMLGGMKPIAPPDITSTASDHESDEDETETVERVVDDKELSAGEGLTKPEEPQAIRMINLIYGESDQNDFMEIVDFFKKELEMDNLSDVILTVLKSAYNAHNEG